MSTAPFGVGGRPRKLRAIVETTPRIGVRDLPRVARLPLTVAREASVSILVNGKPETIDVVSDPRNYGGDGQRFFLCPACSRKVQHLYLLDERLVCRRGAGLTYRSPHKKRRGPHPVRGLRPHLRAPPGPPRFGPPPPPHP